MENTSYRDCDMGTDAMSVLTFHNVLYVYKPNVTVTNALTTSLRFL